MTRVAQAVPNLGHHDAIAREARAVARALTAAGQTTALFAARAHPRADAWQPLAAFRADDWDALILHHSADSSAALPAFRAARCGILLYHNITPPEFFYGVNPDLQAANAAGRAQLDLLLPQARAVWADSTFNLDELRARGVTHGTVIPYLCDPALLPVPGVAPSPLVLAVGRVVPNKGHDFLLAAFAQVRAAVPAARLAIIGNAHGMGVWTARLQRLAAELGVTDAVHWAGECNDATLRDWYARARALAVTSRHEGFCVPLLEAMAAHVPVVARRQGAVVETLGGSGIIVEEDDAAVFAGALRAALTDAPLREAVMLAQRRRLADFAPARVTALLQEALGAALAAPAPCWSPPRAPVPARVRAARTPDGASVQRRYAPLLARTRPRASGACLPDPARVIVVNLGNFGDIVLTSALLRALRADGRVQRLGLLSAFRAADLQPLLPQVDDFFTLRLAPLQPGASRWPSGLRAVRAGHWTAALSARPDYAHHAAAYLTGAAAVVGETGGVQDALLTHPQPAFLTGPAVPLYEGERLARLALPLGLTLPDAAPVLAVPPADAAVTALAAAGPYTVVHAGAATAHKCWPPAHWRELLTRLSAAGERVVITGGPAERELAETLADGLPGVRSAAGELTWPQTAALMAGAARFIGSDSGPLHLAAAYRVPLVALFGPGDTRRFAPRTPGVRILSLHLPCAPCPQAGDLAGPPCPENICLTRLTPDAVLTAVAALRPA